MRWAGTHWNYLFIERGLQNMISIMYSISCVPLEKNRSVHFALVLQTWASGGPKCILRYSPAFSGSRTW